MKQLRYVLLTWFIVFLHAQAIGQAQNAGGLITYKQVIDSREDPRNTPHITLRLLYFKPTASLFTEVPRKATPKARKEIEVVNENNNTGNVTIDTDGQEFHYTDFMAKKIISSERIFTKHFFVQDKLVPVEWKLVKEKKQIGNFTCQKAVASVRNRMYTVWFTPEIPVSAGPWKLSGLPGLILEAASDDGQVKFLFEAVSFGNFNKELSPPSLTEKPLSPEAFIDKRNTTFERIRKAANARSDGNTNFIVDTFSIDQYPK